VYAGEPVVTRSRQPCPPKTGGCAWPEAQTGGGVPVDPVSRAGLARDADVLAGHTGVTAGNDVRAEMSVLAGGRSSSRTPWLLLSYSKYP